MRPNRSRQKGKKPIKKHREGYTGEVYNEEEENSGESSAMDARDEVPETYADEMEKIGMSIL